MVVSEFTITENGIKEKYYWHKTDTTFKGQANYRELPTPDYTENGTHLNIHKRRHSYKLWGEIVVTLM